MIRSSPEHSCSRLRAATTRCRNDSHPGRGLGHLVADDDAVAAGAVGDVLVLGGGAVRVVVGVAAAGATAVDLDAVTLAGDAVALTGARAAVRGGGAVAGQGRVGRGAVGAVRDAGAGGGGGGGAEVGDDVLLVEASGAEAGGKLLNGLLVAEVGIEDVAGGVGSHGLGSNDLRGRERAALGDVAGALGGAGALVLGGRLGRGLAGGRLGGLGGLVLGDVEDVELAAGGGLDSGGLAGVVGDVVAVDDVVVPGALASRAVAGVAEGTLPRARLGGRLVLGKGDLASVVVPRAEEVDGLDAGRDAKRER